jgi:hypothetical protein
VITAIRLLVLAVGTASLAGVAHAQEVARQPGFRVEWAVDPPSRQTVTVSGYVYNEGTALVQYVQVRLEMRDATGAVVWQRNNSVIGDIPPGGRAFFNGVAPAGGATYAVSVASAERAGGGP